MRHVEQQRVRGKTYLYYRNKHAGGKRVRLRGPIGSPEFWEDYNAATEQQGTARDEGTFAWLFAEYYQSGPFRQLSKRSRYVRKGILDNFCKRWGGKRYSHFSPLHARKLRDALSDTPDQANNTLKALRQVFKFAVAYDLAKTNPLTDVEYLRSKNPDGHRAWTLEDVEAYEARHPVGTKARLALALLIYTGQRRGDIVTLGRQHERNGWLRFTQQKTGKTLEIPVLAPLRDIIDASPTGDLTYLVTAFNKPFTANGFGNWFRKRCNEAGLTGCTAHGLRKAAGYRMAERGCTAHEIAAILGHDTLKEVERYTKAAQQRVLAGSVSQKLGSLFPKDLQVVEKK